VLTEKLIYVLLGQGVSVLAVTELRGRHKRLAVLFVIFTKVCHVFFTIFCRDFLLSLRMKDM